MGAVTENYVAQQLAAKGNNLYYWESEYSAELDFVIQRNNIIYAIEVKKGEHTKSKSLNIFTQRYKPYEVMRFSLKNFGETEKNQSNSFICDFCV